jgi:hypothetical protein
MKGEESKKRQEKETIEWMRGATTKTKVSGLFLVQCPGGGGVIFVGLIEGSFS